MVSRRVLAATVLLVAACPAGADPTPWNLALIGAPAARTPGRAGSGVVVAVVDSWVDPSHPGFGDRVLPGVDCVGGCRPNAYTADRCEHGTHVAGVVAAETYGVAPAARILPLRVLAWDGALGECTGNPADVAAAVRFAVANGAGVVNVSVGATAADSGDEFAAAVADAAAAGVVVVLAAGTAAAPLPDRYGGTALVVSAVDPTGTLAPYAQRGAGVDVAAPGGDAPGGECTAAGCIVSTWPALPDEPERYAALAGTSMAAPHVSGVAALLLGERPDRGRADVLARIRRTARPVEGAGAGLVDAAAALGAVPPPAQRAVVAAQAPGTRPGRAAPQAPSPAAAPPAGAPAWPLGAAVAAGAATVAALVLSRRRA